MPPEPSPGPQVRSAAGVQVEVIDVQWEAPTGVQAAVTTRRGGSSLAPFSGFNLGAHVGDDPECVARHRATLEATWKTRVAWLDQVHGAGVVDAAAVCVQGRPATADASWTDQPGVACAVLVADCLPVLLAASNGHAVGAAHAGWRGLAAGVIESAVQAVARAAACAPQEVVAWLGPCIGPAHFEVGEDVLLACGDLHRFTPRPRSDGSPRWLADLPGLARDRLARLGMHRVSGGDWCTVSDPSRFFSFRRDRVTGRLAAAVWRDA